MIDFKRLIKSFAHAFCGVKVVFQSEQSFRLQSVSSVFAILLGVWLHIRASEWIILFVLIGTVLCLEMINSVFERMIDSFKPRIHPIVRETKDIMAATVLLMSSIAFLVGAIIFWPHLYILFH